jgi:hypothetical protein
MRKHFILLCAFAITANGCMTERVQPATEYPSVPKQSTFLVKKIDYDVYGRPLFRGRTAKRPGAAGERFTIVHAVNDRPSRSYDIAIVERQKADMGKPLSVVYEWTGKGFEVGLAISRGIVPSSYSASSSNDALVFLAAMTAPVVVGGVTGFVVGIVSCIPETVVELKNLLVNARETVINYTVYEYDEKGRIRFMKLYPPIEHAQELVKTEFHYAGDREEPSKTEVTSLIEKSVRVIQHE